MRGGAAWRRTRRQLPRVWQVNDDAKERWRWLPQWAPTFAVVVALLAAVVPASFYLGRRAGWRQGGRGDDVRERVSALEARDG